MSNRVQGKVVLISGAARGMGEAEARLFADEGACVVLGDIRDQPGASVADAINEQRGSRCATYAHLDVTSAADWHEAVNVAERTFGGLDVLVNNAGVLGMSGVEQESEAEWDRINNINVKGVWLGMKAAVPAMRRRDGGSIVNISSIYGLIGSGAAAAYQASKGAVRILTKTAAVQYAPEHIRINSVHPGITATPMVIDGLDLPTREAIWTIAPVSWLRSR
jgi:cyclopentanol dehydrogenase